jgi:hypothetical protein
MAGLFELTYPILVRAEGADPTLPESLKVAVRTVARAAVLVSPRQVDATACAPVGRSPGVVRADFDGDGRDDYALLLKTRDTGKVTIWEGKALRQAEFAFAFFLADGSGGFKARVVQRYLSYLPTSEVIQLQPAGRIRQMETNRTITLKHPGVTLVFCEKSATTYYLAAGKILSIPVAD